MKVELRDLTVRQVNPIAVLEMPAPVREGELIQLPELRYKVQSITWHKRIGSWVQVATVTPDRKRI